MTGRPNGPTRKRAANALQSAHSSRLAGQGWFAAWLDRIAADGTLTRLVRRGRRAAPRRGGTCPGKATGAADRSAGSPNRVPGVLPLPVLAEWATGDTKALVPGAPLEQLVLRAAPSAPVTGTSVPRERAGRRALWESAGAIADDLASQVLVLNIGAERDTVVCDWLRDAAGFGIPFRLTLHQLATDPVVPAARTIFVCENPAVLRAAAGELRAPPRRLCAPRASLPPPATNCSATPYAREPGCTGAPTSTGPACVSPRTPWPATRPTPGG